MPALNVAVIGAGAAGLVTARELRRAGHDVSVFEQGDKIGGVWVYSAATEDDPLGRTGARIHSSLYASLRTNLPRELMAFADYPFDSSGGGADGWPSFPGHAQVREYLDGFARAFAILPLIRFATKVVRVESGAGWLVETIEGATVRRESFDAVAVCNGHYSEPRIPDLPGADHFPARITHSHNYREPHIFTGQRVALLGASASAIDLCAEIARVAATVYCCADAFASLPLVAQTTSNIHRLPGIAALNDDGSIRLTDGTRIDPVDALVYCTGYRYRYPFLARDTIRVEDNWVQPLYHDLLHREHPTLAFIGVPFRVVPFPLFELQAQWFARLLAGAFQLPSLDERRADSNRRIAALRASGVKPRLFHQRALDCYDYLDALADQCGAPRVSAQRRELTAAFMAHVAADPATYRDRPLP